MCRLFAFRSVIQSQVHRSLVSADNALSAQSADHPDGWGVAYFVDGAPHITRSPTAAINSQLFRRVSGVVASETVLAHVRRATQGELSVLNCHPFQYGRWVMAHNGDIPNFQEHRAELIERVAPRLRRYILGDTDSEVVFFIFLTQLAAAGELTRRVDASEAADALKATESIVRDICDPCSKSAPDTQHALLTMIATDGTTMVALQGGKELHWSTYKSRCPDRETCPSLSGACEAPSTNGYVNHLIFSSEVISGDNIWHAMQPGDVIGVDWRMKVHHHHARERKLAVV